MDQIVFQHDTVLSDVHMHLPNTHHLMTRLSGAGQPVFRSRFKILADTHKDDNHRKLSEKTKEVTTASHGEEKDGEKCAEHVLDEDGDLDIPQRTLELEEVSSTERTEKREPSQKVKLSFYRPRKSSDGRCRDPVCPVILKQSSPVLDWEESENDCDKDTIRIEHTMATPLEDVGKQVWRGALLMADFILSKPETFSGATVLELGAGTGLTSIVMANTAKTVYCTDVGDDLLNLCRRNVLLNKHVMASSGGEVRVKHLDWLQHSLCTDADVDFSWTEEEVADLYDNTCCIIAADVCYDEDLTDGLFRTLYRLCSNFLHTCTVYISIEKRMNFSLRDMDISCEAYNHFLHCLSEIQKITDGRCTFRVERVPSDFAQFLVYERVQQLELWKITSSPLITKKSPSDSNNLSSESNALI